jgi:phenylpyruvate tautomerase PptA (4-oxalocrotonate tautomerase family)
MPVVIIDIPSGLKSSAKEQLHKELAESMHDAYQIPDNRVYLREWAAEHTSFDGVIGAAFRPICHYIVPPTLTVESRRKLVSRVSSAVNRALDLRPEVVALPSGEQVSTRWLLQFFFEVPLEQAALDDLMAFENPMVPKGKH